MTTFHWTNLEPLIREISKEQSWRLTPEETSYYAKSIIPYLPKDIDEAWWRAIIQNFHRDHALVNSLKESDTSAWNTLLRDIQRIIRTQVPLYAHDELSLDDATQIVSEEILRSLKHYAYASRFSTWTHTIAVRTIHRYLRARNAMKRTSMVESLDTPGSTIDKPILNTDQPEEIAESKALVNLIDSILSADADQRLARMFSLWALEDTRLSDIGRILHLSPSRVSVLLGEIREKLRNHPAILEWMDMHQEKRIK